jgi:hypothetical protein
MLWRRERDVVGDEQHAWPRGFHRGPRPLRLPRSHRPTGVDDRRDVCAESVRPVFSRGLVTHLIPDVTRVLAANSVTSRYRSRTRPNVASRSVPGGLRPASAGGRATQERRGSRAGLAQPSLLAGGRVGPGIDLDPQRPAGKLLCVTLRILSHAAKAGTRDVSRLQRLVPRIHRERSKMILGWSPFTESNRRPSPYHGEITSSEAGRSEPKLTV